MLIHSWLSGVSALDIGSFCGYNVTTMASITTKLVKDGNSTAVRIPKALLEMSGLSGVVEIEAKKGVVTIKETKSPRAGWEDAIKQNPVCTPDAELADWDDLAEDPLDEW